jgi:hypothetical protein
LLSGSLSTPSAKGVFIPPTSFESIQTVTVGSGGSATVTFTSIPATYTHLQVRILARSGRSDADTGAGGLYMQLNSNFLTSQHLLRGSGSAAYADAYSGGLSNGYIMVWVPTSNATANIFGAGIIDILDYANTNKNKVVKTLSGDDLNGNGYIALTSGLWNSTNAITSITFGSTDGAGNIPQYSQFALYGIKGA